MITLLLACVVLAGTPFIPPKDWTVEKIEIPATYSVYYTLPNFPEPQRPEEKTVTVHLKRTMQAGDIISPPRECSLKVDTNPQSRREE